MVKYFFIFIFIDSLDGAIVTVMWSEVALVEGYDMFRVDGRRYYPKITIKKRICFNWIEFNSKKFKWIFCWKVSFSIEQGLKLLHS